MIYVVDERDVKELPWPLVEGKTIYHQLSRIIDMLEEDSEQDFLLAVGSTENERVVLQYLPGNIISVVGDLANTRKSASLQTLAQSTRKSSLKELEEKMSKMDTDKQKAANEPEEFYQKMKDDLDTLGDALDAEANEEDTDATE